MKEKVTTLFIEKPTLTREELQNHMGAPAIPEESYTISFDRRIFTNRCPIEIGNRISETIKPEEIHRWKFARGGGLLYQPNLRRLAKESKMTEIKVDGKKIPKWIELTSREKEYLEHDKKVKLFCDRLARKGIFLYPMKCQNRDNECPIPKKTLFLKSLPHYAQKSPEQKEEA